jgi:DNA invertase Pin-like site-specific DNA recombinase
MKMETKAGELRRRIEGRPGGRHAGMHGQLREDVVAYVRSRVASGVTQVQIARELGVTQTSVSRWCRAMKGVETSALVPVEIVDAIGAQRSSRVTVVSPRGLRVEGLDLDAVCVVLARLG